MVVKPVLLLCKVLFAFLTAHNVQYSIPNHSQSCNSFLSRAMTYWALFTLENLLLFLIKINESRERQIKYIVKNSQLSLKPAFLVQIRRFLVEVKKIKFKNKIIFRNKRNG